MDRAPAIGSNMSCEAAFHLRLPAQLSTWVILLSEPQSYRLADRRRHPLFRGALREAVTGVFDRAEVAEAGTFEEVSELLERGGGDIDLILLDLRMPGVRGFSGLMYLRAQYPEPADRRGLGHRRSRRDPAAASISTAPPIHSEHVRSVFGINPETPTKLMQRRDHGGIIGGRDHDDGQAQNMGRADCVGPEKPRTPGMRRSSRIRSISPPPRSRSSLTSSNVPASTTRRGRTRRSPPEARRRGTADDRRPVKQTIRLRLAQQDDPGGQQSGQTQVKRSLAAHVSADRRARSIEPQHSYRLKPGPGVHGVGGSSTTC